MVMFIFRPLIVLLFSHHVVLLPFSYGKEFYRSIHKFYIMSFSLSICMKKVYPIIVITILIKSKNLWIKHNSFRIFFIYIHNFRDPHQAQTKQQFISWASFHTSPRPNAMHSRERAVVCMTTAVHTATRPCAVTSVASCSSAWTHKTTLSSFITYN